MPVQLLFAIAIVALGVAVLFVATGGVGRIAAAVGETVSGFLSDLTATPVPSSAPATVSDPPLLRGPDEPYTNVGTVDLVGEVPTDVAGTDENRIRIYVALGDQAPAPVTEVPVGDTTRFLVPGVALEEGTNAFTATVIGPAGESAPSAAATYVFDSAKPNIKLRNPKDGALVNASSVEVSGQTQARSALSFTNTTTSETVIGAADDAGNFKLFVPIGEGLNALELTATDPAGNVQLVGLSVTKGSGVLTAVLSASFHRVRIGRLPKKVGFEVVVTNPDGKPLEGAAVTFSFAVPGIPVIASRALESAADGRVAWSATIPKGSATGQAWAVVYVKTADFGETTDRTVIDIAK